MSEFNEYRNSTPSLFCNTQSEDLDVLSMANTSAHTHPCDKEFINDKLNLNLSYRTDYEILELVLEGSVSPNTSAHLTRNLLAAFGSLGSIFAAPKHRLEAIEGFSEQVFFQIQLLRVLVERSEKLKFLHKDIILSWSSFVNYCRIALRNCEIEKILIFFINSENNFIAEEIHATGSVARVSCYPREVAKRALEMNASSIVLVHNHPSGDPTPSDEDRDMTKNVQLACEAVGIRIYDHIIVGNSSETSFRAKGYL